MSPWWGTYDGVVLPINQSPEELKAVGEPCYNNTHTLTKKKKHLELMWHAPTCQPSHTRTVRRSRGGCGGGRWGDAVGQSREMGGISHFVRRCTMASLRWMTSHRGRQRRGEEELEDGEKWKRAAQMAHGEWKRGKIEAEMWTWDIQCPDQPPPSLVKYLKCIFFGQLAIIWNNM